MEKDSGHELKELAVDGGMSNSDLCMQVCQSNQSPNLQRTTLSFPPPGPPELTPRFFPPFLPPLFTNSFPHLRWATEYLEPNHCHRPKQI